YARSALPGAEVRALPRRRAARWPRAPARAALTALLAGVRAAAGSAGRPPHAARDGARDRRHRADRVGRRVRSERAAQPAGAGPHHSADARPAAPAPCRDRRTAPAAVPRGVGAAAIDPGAAAAPAATPPGRDRSVAGSWRDTDRNRGGHARPLTGVKEEREISLKRKKTISLSSSSLVAPDVAVTGACVCSQDAARLGVGTQIRPAWCALQRLAA